jgi:hypothetical protein
LTDHSQIFAHTDCGTSNYYFEAIEVEVFESGCYNLVSNSTIGTYGYIYQDYFKPVIPTDNLFSQIGRAHRDDLFELQTSLLINTKYILVVTTFNPNVTGVFSVVLTGSNIVNFNRISEYLSFFFVISR